MVADIDLMTLSGFCRNCLAKVTPVSAFAGTSGKGRNVPAAEELRQNLESDRTIEPAPVVASSIRPIKLSCFAALLDPVIAIRTNARNILRNTKRKWELHDTAGNDDGFFYQMQSQEGKESICKSIKANDTIRPHSSAHFQLVVVVGSVHVWSSPIIFAKTIPAWTRLLIHVTQLELNAEKKTVTAALALNEMCKLLTTAVITRNGTIDSCHLKEETQWGYTAGGILPKAVVHWSTRKNSIFCVDVKCGTINVVNRDEVSERDILTTNQITDWILSKLRMTIKIKENMKKAMLSAPSLGVAPQVVVVSTRVDDYDLGEPAKVAAIYEWISKSTDSGTTDSFAKYWGEEIV